MALYRWRCAPCDMFEETIGPGASKAPTCGCGRRMRRSQTPPSSQTKEVLDNGVMTRRLERLADAEQLYKDRANNDPRLKRD